MVAPNIMTLFCLQPDCLFGGPQKLHIHDYWCSIVVKCLQGWHLCIESALPDADTIPQFHGGMLYDLVRWLCVWLDLYQLPEFLFLYETSEAEPV
jgi:hypothetical protein